MYRAVSSVMELGMDKVLLPEKVGCSSPFDKSIVQATLHLKEHGWAIIEDVLTRCDLNIAGLTGRDPLACDQAKCLVHSS
jgi:hypothetical protein